MSVPFCQETGRVDKVLKREVQMIGRDHLQLIMARPGHTVTITRGWLGWIGLGNGLLPHSPLFSPVHGHSYCSRILNDLIVSLTIPGARNAPGIWPGAIAESGFTQRDALRSNDSG